MNAPFYEFGFFGDRASLGVALIIGIAFGWCLERAGLGSAKKLSGQFYLNDLTVFKVMFTAIVTAMLGTFWLGRLGMLDLSRVYVPDTYVVPQLAGGALFGVGFVLGGLCPGTSCVAAASGRLDGAMVVAGIWFGVLGSGLWFGKLAAVYNATPRGVLTLPAVLGLPYGVVVAVVVGLALAGFRAAEWVERRGAR
jgi:hypothetical protein